jgi:hypothetical protein
MSRARAQVRRVDVTDFGVKPFMSGLRPSLEFGEVESGQFTCSTASVYIDSLKDLDQMFVGSSSS